jgi:hypothetical protein
MMKRDKCEQEEIDMHIPGSPAFISSQTKYFNMCKKGGYRKLRKTVDFAKEKNIPFCSEEDKYYRFKQLNTKMKNFKKTLNDCFETKIPEQFDVGMRMMTDHPRKQE